MSEKENKRPPFNPYVVAKHTGHSPFKGNNCGVSHQIKKSFVPHKPKEVQGINRTQQVNGVSNVQVPSNLQNKGKNAPVRSKIINQNHNIVKEPHNGTTFQRRRVVLERRRLLDLSNIWKKEKERKDVPLHAKDEIDRVVGQTVLLTSNKFKQFAELIDMAVRRPQSVKLSDLDGFWEMMYIQVENLNKRYEDLAELKKRKWVEPKVTEPAKVVKVAPPKTKPVSKTSAKSNFREFLLAKKKGLEVAPNSKDSKSQKLEVPRADESSKLRTQLNQLKVEKARRSSTGITVLRMSHIAKAICSPLPSASKAITPRRGILKTCQERSARKAVMFEFNTDQGDEFFGDNVKPSVDVSTSVETFSNEQPPTTGIEMLSDIQPSTDLETSSYFVQPSADVENLSDVLQPSIGKEISNEVVQPSTKVEFSSEIEQPSTEVEFSSEFVQPLSEVRSSSEVVQSSTEMESSNEVVQYSIEVKSSHEVEQYSFEVESSSQIIQTSTEAESVSEVVQPSTDVESSSDVVHPSQEANSNQAADGNMESIMDELSKEVERMELPTPRRSLRILNKTLATPTPRRSMRLLNKSLMNDSLVKTTPMRNINFNEEENLEQLPVTPFRTPRRRTKKCPNTPFKEEDQS